MEKGKDLWHGGDACEKRLVKSGSIKWSIEEV